MRSGVAAGRWVIWLIGSLLMLLVGPAASASGAASVRFVHAVPGAGAATLSAAADGGPRQIGSAAFGEVSGYASVPAGRARLELRAVGGRRLATLRERLSNRAHYTAVAVGHGSAKLRLLRDGRARPGDARLRVVQTAPELGPVDVRLGDRRVARLAGFESVAGYRSVDPGAYAIRVTAPGDASSLAARGGVPLTAGTASTAFVVGSAGEPLGVVVANDRSAAPRGAPQTGLGGLAGDDGTPLLLALLAGLLAATAGAGGYVAMTGRSRGRDS